MCLLDGVKELKVAGYSLKMSHFTPSTFDIYVKIVELSYKSNLQIRVSEKFENVMLEGDMIRLSTNGFFK